MGEESRPILPGRNKSGWTSQLVLAATAAVIGSSFQFGYNTGVINAPGDIIQQFINETYYYRHGSYVEAVQLKFLWGLTVSIFAIGGMLGSAVSGTLAGRFGRKRAMLGNNILIVIAITLMGCCRLVGSYEMLIVGRLVVGVACGIDTALAPLYLTEISPIQLRGVLGISNQLGIVIAIMISQILGLEEVLGTVEYWPYLIVLCGAFTVYQFLTLPFCPETPTYLLSQGMEDEAREALQFLRGSLDVEDEIAILVSEQNKVQSSARVGMIGIFRNPDLRKPMFIAIVLQLAQQLSGINAVLYYSTSLFESANISPDESDFYTVGMGAANIVMTALSLLLIERLGRRTLLLAGLGGMCICAAILVVSLTVGDGTSWGGILAIVAVLSFVITFQSGPGSIPWFITAEFFTQAARTAAMSIAGVFNWGGNFAVGLAYPPLQKTIDGYTFIIFATLIAIFWLFTYFRVPETKGRNIEEISNSFKSQ
ncbi:solute carrier family 2, facilitated glucose transporter member 3-like [Styela clava]